MFNKSDKLAKLHQHLVGSFKGTDGPEVRMLPEGQMVIRKSMIPNPALEQSGKVETFIPDTDGYQIYVAYRSQNAYAATAATSQRMVGPKTQPATWDEKSMKLQVDRDLLTKDWLILNGDGWVISVSVQCGSEHMLDEINWILAQIAATLLE